MAIQSKRGRKPKGAREQISAKVPTEHKPLLELEAMKAGLPLCDYVAVVLAEAHGWPTPGYVNKGAGQEELPIGA